MSALKRKHTESIARGCLIASQAVIIFMFIITTDKQVVGGVHV